MKIIYIFFGLFIGIPVLCLEAIFKIICVILSLLILVILLPYADLFERFTNSNMLIYACYWNFKHVDTIKYSWFLTRTVVNRINTLTNAYNRY